MKQKKLHVGLLICTIISVGVAVVTIIVAAVVGVGAILWVFGELLRGWQHIG